MNYFNHKSFLKINEKKKIQNNKFVEKHFQKTKKILYLSPYFWKKTFLFQQSFAFKYSEKFIFSRSSTVPYSFLKQYVEIYAGKKWYGRVIHKWNLGFKLGELTWNRKIARYKAKQLKKKKKK